jgi:ABC-type lipoprotein release transport system permease subunit
MNTVTKGLKEAFNQNDSFPRFMAAFFTVMVGVTALIVGLVALDAWHPLLSDAVMVYLFYRVARFAVTGATRKHNHKENQ